ncbi:MAG: hypothetical protein HQL54_11185 [Magnetococcales bacterium]|nr:hypothetical protein [Magnetococcales bacterium]
MRSILIAVLMGLSICVIVQPLQAQEAVETNPESTQSGPVSEHLGAAGHHLWEAMKSMGEASSDALVTHGGSIKEGAKQMWQSTGEALKDLKEQMFGDDTNMDQLKTPDTHQPTI